MAKIRNRYNQVPHLAQDTNGKVTNSQTLRHHKREPRGQDNLQIYYSSAPATVLSKDTEQRRKNASWIESPA